jgi:GTP pyrophosphokinase
MEKNLSPSDLEKKLLTKINSYLDKQGIEQVVKSIKIAQNAHINHKRMSGEPYIVHPFNTALRLTDLKLDSNTIVAAVLHDTLEDTNLTPIEIKKNFGQEVFTLVDSVTKLSHIRIKKSWFPIKKLQTEEMTEYERQAETLRKMLVAMAKDIRVILIKLADKIHNLETLQYLPEPKRERIAKESIEIFAPIAQRLGIANWQGLIEDLAFPYAMPIEYKKLKSLAVPEIKIREKYLKKIEKIVTQIAKKNLIDTQTSFRAKRWYSLYKKLQRYENNITKIYDLVAIRIIVQTVEQCYGMLGVIHSLWRPLPGRIKDYIALPKPNGYQSLHTTVFCDEGKIVEFQIRTFEMDHKANFGVASHWLYKKSKNNRFLKKDELKWIHEFYNAQKNINSSEELQDSFKMDLFQDRIFVFTPMGDVKDLPKGATPVDFAYCVHSDLGSSCGGAIINGKIAPLDKKLENGDIVEIIKRKSARPRSDWLKFVKTQSARSKIKKSVGI